ncbi:MAG TPA: dihydroneopterin aldolase [Bacteroidia bacterium]|nr:dihydroneopterin aldolase [Bacteroidia bacterium]
MHKIILEQIKIYGFHGCLPEEAKIGGEYLIDVTLETDFSKAAKTDNLSETIDYVAVYEIVKKEMAQRSNLIENVAQRILDALKKKFSTLLHAEIKITKVNPPLNGNVPRVSVVVGF